MRRRPDFFILGAPKCGTTSLAAWLREHPAIFLPAIKEPHFFNTDDRRGVATLDGYEDLFGEADETCLSVGEASVWYLSSADAVRNILAYRADARFIVMLRNPVEMAPALHAEMVLTGHENIRDFRAAWELRDERRRGRHLPPLVWARRRLDYGEICSHGAQIERLFSLVDPRQVLVVVLDDVVVDARREYRRILRFLGVHDDDRAVFPIHNRARIARSPRLTRLLFVLTQLKARLGIKRGLGLWGRIANLNVIESPRDDLSEETRILLRKYFALDVERLSRLIDRDCRSWVATAPLAQKPDTIEPALSAEADPSPA